MADLTYTSSRCTNKLGMRIVRREGTVFSVFLTLDGYPPVRFEPNGLGQLADWFEDNARALRAEHDANTGVSSGTVEEGGM